jgi:hypothetical protein
MNDRAANNYILSMEIIKSIYLLSAEHRDIVQGVRHTPKLREQDRRQSIDHSQCNLG